MNKFHYDIEFGRGKILLMNNNRYIYSNLNVCDDH